MPHFPTDIRAGRPGTAPGGGGLTRRMWAVTAAGGGIVFLIMGTRASLGVFLPVVSADLGGGRETFSLAVALLNLIMGLPIAAYLADRFNHRFILLAGSAVYGAAMLAVSTVSSGTGLILLLGAAGGVGMSAVSLALVIAAVGQLVPDADRTTALGVVTAAASLGMFALAPAFEFAIELVGWRASFGIIAATALVMAGLSWMFPGRRPNPGERPPDLSMRTSNFMCAQTAKFGTGERPPDLSMRTLLGKARNRSYLLLTAGFFVCGFHVGFVATHLPAYLADRGLSLRAASLSLAMIGLFNIAGSFVFGRLGNYFRKRTLLAVLYGMRALLMIGLLAAPLTPVTAAVFGAAIGFVWLATVPLTSAAAAHLGGVRYLSTMFGVVFFSHQIGSFLGVWLGGRLFDATGDYRAVWWAAIGLGLFAMFIHLPIDDGGSPRRPPVAADRQPA